MRYRRREERGEDKYENAVDFTGSYCNCPDRDLDCASGWKENCIVCDSDGDCPDYAAPVLYDVCYVDAEDELDLLLPANCDLWQ